MNQDNLDLHFKLVGMESLLFTKHIHFKCTYASPISNRHERVKA